MKESVSYSWLHNLRHIINWLGIGIYSKIKITIFFFFFVCVSNPHSPLHWSGLRPHLHSAMAPVSCCLYVKALLSTPLSTHAALRDLQLADSSSCLQRAVPLGHYHTGTRLQVMSGALVTGWYAALSQETFAQRTTERNVQPERDWVEESWASLASCTGASCPSPH